MTNEEFMCDDVLCEELEDGDNSNGHTDETRLEHPTGYHSQ